MEPTKEELQRRLDQIVDALLPYIYDKHSYSQFTRGLCEQIVKIAKGED